MKKKYTSNKAITLVALVYRPLHDQFVYGAGGDQYKYMKCGVILNKAGELIVTPGNYTYSELPTCQLIYVAQ